MDRPSEAQKAGKLALDTFKRLQDNIWVAKVLQMTASVNLKKGTPKGLREAHRDAEEGLNYFSIVGDTKEEAATLLTLAKVQLLRQEYQDASIKAEKAASLCRDCGYRKGEAAALREVTTALVQLHEESEVALQAAMEALELSDELGDPLGEIEARKILADIYVKNGVSEMAIQALTTALEAARELKERRQIRAVLEQVVQVHIGNGLTEKSLVEVQKEVKLAKTSGDARRQLAAYQTLGTLQSGMGDNDEALETAKEAVKMAGESGDKKVEAWALQLVAEVSAAAERYEQALAEVEKARALFKEVGDIKEVANTWNLACNIQMQMGSNNGALTAKNEQRAVYKEAGWREEELTELLSLAELHGQVKGPRDAVKTAKEALTLCQEAEDKAGEATVMLSLANFQASARSFTDALQSLRGARRLFQTIGDVNGEANVLLFEGNIYFDNGRADEAVKVITEGLELCRKESERKIEAVLLQNIVSMRVQEVRKEALSGRKPSEKPLEHALDVISQSGDLARSLGDLEAQVDAMIQLSSVYAMNKDEASVESAQEALQLAIKLDNAFKVGNSLLALAEAHVSQDQWQDAMDAAREAGNQFQAAGDQASYEAALQVAEAAKQSMERPKTAGPAASGGLGGQGEEARNFGDRLRGGGTNARANGSGLSRPAGSDPPPMSQKKSFSFGPGASKLAAEKHFTPDQDLRKRQLQEANEAPARPPRLLAEEAAPGAGLKEVLQGVRPDWTVKEVHSVQEKLAKINVSSKAELFRLLRSQGAGGVNKMLKNAGQKILKIETLQALLERANE
uniref:Anaphase-promoting complex subunit 5 domain-containing protein n=1 Tax=Pyrodinium bahamense TaxID=73915 RepID=A0A7S0A9E6_9DINO